MIRSNRGNNLVMFFTKSVFCQQCKVTRNVIDVNRNIDKLMNHGFIPGLCGVNDLKQGKIIN